MRGKTHRFLYLCITVILILAALKLSRELFFKNQIFLVWDWACLKALQVILSAASVETYCIIVNNLATYLQSSLTHRAFIF